MHRHTTHNKCYATFKDFSIAMLNFLRDDVPRNWRTYCDEVTDNFRVIDPKKFPALCSSHHQRATTSVDLGDRFGDVLVMFQISSRFP
jgi:hypothetical protein